jgi:hypothetical protein
MTTLEILQTLTGPGWRLSRDEILASTPAWINRVLFAERDRRGNLVRTAPAAEPVRSFADLIREQLRMQGWPEHLIEKETRNRVQPAP